MNRKKFLEIYDNKMNYLEKIFFEIFYQDYGDEGLSFLTPQYIIERPDGSGREWRYDFLIETDQKKYIIETDGLYYHASGSVTPEYFTNLQDKQNYITSREGYKLIRFTREVIENEPDKIINDLRQAFQGDKQISNLWLKRYGDEIKPYEVQELALQAIENYRNDGENKGLIALATGLGKTYLSAFDVKRFGTEKFLFLVHLNHVKVQAFNSYQEVISDKVDEMMIFANDPSGNFLFSTVQKMHRKDVLYLFKKDHFDYIVIDEGHHTAAESYKQILDYFEPKFLIGLTGTPYRTDLQDIMKFYDDNLIFEMNQEEAIQKGYLVPYKYFGFLDNVDYSNIRWNGRSYDQNDLNRLLMIERRDKAILEKYHRFAVCRLNEFREDFLLKNKGKEPTKEQIDEYLSDCKLTKPKKTIAYCVSIEHADYMVGVFKKEGYRCKAMHSNSPDSSVILEEFRNNKFDIIFAVDMFNEGVDVKDVECLLQLRPTESVVILRQQLGRGLRISLETFKKDVLILDFVGNYRTAGQILTTYTNDNIPTERKKLGEKDVFYYDNNGCEVYFETEVIDVFTELRSEEKRRSREVDLSNISQEWLDYSSNLKYHNDGRLFWKRGQHNANIKTHLEAIKIKHDNPDISYSDWKDEMENLTDFRASTRALILSRQIGLLDQDNNITQPFNRILKESENLKNISLSQSLIDDQIEKLFYFSSIFSTYSRYVPENENQEFLDYDIYPIFFIYQVFVELINRGENPQFTKYELYYFIAISKNHNEVKEVVDNILNYRHTIKREMNVDLDALLYKNTDQIRSNSRIHHIFNSISSITVTTGNNPIYKLKENQIELIINKVNKFEEIFNRGHLITFKKSEKEFFNLLYSNKDLLNFHEKD